MLGPVFRSALSVTIGVALVSGLGGPLFGPLFGPLVGPLAETTAQAQIAVVDDFSSQLEQRSVSIVRASNRAFVMGSFFGTNQIDVIDLDTNDRIALLEEQPVSHPSLSPDESRLFTAGPTGFLDPKFRFYRTDDLGIAGDVRVDLLPRDRDLGTGWSPNGERAFALVDIDGGEARLFAFDVATLTEIAQIEVPGVLEGGALWHFAAPGPDPRGIVNRIGGDAPGLVLVALGSLAVAAEIELVGGSLDIAFSNDGDRAWVSHGTPDLVSEVDLEGRSVDATIATAAGPREVEIDESLGILVVTCLTDEVVQVFDLATRSMPATVPIASRPGGLSLVPLEGIALVTTEADTVEAVDVAPGSPGFSTVVQTLPLPGCDGNCLPADWRCTPTAAPPTR